MDKLHTHWEPSVLSNCYRTHSMLILQKKALEETLQQRPNNLVANSRYALTLWALQTHSNWRDRIKLPFLIDHHLRMALTPDIIESPDDPIDVQMLYYFGRLKFEFAHFSFIERCIYKWLTIPLPTDDYLQQAHDLFARVHKIDPTFEQNLFYLALCAFELGRHADAVRHLKILLELPFTQIDDDELREQAAYLLTEIVFEMNADVENQIPPLDKSYIFSK